MERNQAFAMENACTSLTHFAEVTACKKATLSNKKFSTAKCMGSNGDLMTALSTMFSLQPGTMSFTGGGYIAGSLAMMTDAAHFLVDFASFMISLCSLWLSSRLSSRPTTKRLNYGWHRAEIHGTLLSIFAVWLVTLVLVYLACERLISNNYTIDGTVMLITSGCTALANIIMGLTLHQTGHGHSHGIRSPPQANASVRAAFIHVLGDLLQSLSVLVRANIIFFKLEYKIAAPVCTFLFSVFVVVKAFTILWDILLVLMKDRLLLVTSRCSLVPSVKTAARVAPFHQGCHLPGFDLDSPGNDICVRVAENPVDLGTVIL
ncbi:zinc transporter 8-like [Polyodon spathula]|uniref:zinc transporter 8-like n=1 Tax=Polyodon spathula TaxID=7913 RepID=UPI001B7F1323|nr:zinc transporter 8-like [Polyodon spathula]